MRLGLIARADLTGLGIQTHGFYQHLKPTKTLVIDLSHLNGQANDLSLYPDATVLHHTPYPATHEGHPGVQPVFDEFLEDLDIVLTCETPYDYYLFTEARRRGVKSVLQYNFELLDHVREPHLPQPDLFVAPSRWRMDDVHFDNKIFLPVPVDRSRLPFVQRTEATTFLHVVGNPAMEDRNGTRALIEAWAHVKTDSRLVVRTQWPNIPAGDSRIEIVHGRPLRHEELYDRGDVFIMPRKFGGLCLPLNEALSLGMPAVMTDLAPQNEFLHPAGLVPATLDRQAMTKTMIDIFEPDRHALAGVIDQLASDPELVVEMSTHSDRVADLISWENLGPLYVEAFESLLQGRTPSQAFSWEFERI